MTAETTEAPNRIEEVRARLQAQANQVAKHEADEIEAETKPKHRIEPKKLANGIAVGVLSCILLATFYVLVSTISGFNQARSLTANPKTLSPTSQSAQRNFEGVTIDELIRKAMKDTDMESLPAEVQSVLKKYAPEEAETEPAAASDEHEPAHESDEH